MAPWRLLLLLIAAVLLPQAAQAEERILYFLSDIAVQPDGELAVSETIRVQAEGDAIKRGIFRDVPTVYGGGLLGGVRIPFEVVEVLRNGEREPWRTETVSNGVRIWIGDADVMLTPGLHEYLIRYEISRQVGFFDDYDELYWNVTGNGWQFPIDVAEARVKLPQPTTFGQRAVYTGPQGATGQNARVTEENADQIFFATTAPLAAYEGLTVAVAWPKGIIAPPDSQQKFAWWVRDFGPPAVAIAGLLAVLAYYFHAWRMAGRGPPPGTVVPIFAPQDELSPAGMRFVTEMGSDNRAFAAALIELGVRGHLRLVEGEKPFFGRPKTTIERQDGGQPVGAAESAMKQKLFSGGESIVMENKNHSTFSSAQKALSSNLKKQYEGKLFIRNWSWSLRGLAIMLAAIWLTAVCILLTSASSDPRATGVALLSALGMVGAVLLFRRAPASGTSSGLLIKIGAGILGVVAVLLGIATLGMALEQGRILPLLIPLLSLPVVVSAFWWMAAPTKEGRAVLDRIEGFKQYLSITEEERLDRMHPPEKTPELFEKYLPYAIALEVENEWADRFAGVLAAASVAAQGQAMGWYSGHSNPWSDTGDFVDRVGSSLSSTVASASTAPGSSSGSGGGGSSGGGGGGGGGGGW